MKLPLLALLWSVIAVQVNAQDTLSREQIFEATKAKYQPIVDSLDKLQQRHYKNIVRIDRRGLWVGLHYGWSKERYQEKWRVDTTCGCNGTIISIDTNWYDKTLARTATLSLTYRFSQRWGMRGAAQFSWLTVPKGGSARDLAGNFAQLPQTYRFRQQAANMSFVYYMGNTQDPFRQQRLHIYTGAGANWRFRLQETQPQIRTTETPKPAAFSNMGKPSVSNTFQPIGFLGVRAGTFVQVTYEIGWNATFYNTFSIEIPLSARIKKSKQKHTLSVERWIPVLYSRNAYQNLIIAKEYELFPERFPIHNDSGGDGGGGGGDAGGGSSGGGACGGTL